MMRHTTLITLSILAMLLTSQAVSAEEAVGPSIYHVPKMSAQGGQALHVYAMVFEDWKLEETYLAYKPIGAPGEFERVKFKRASERDFVAIVPAADVQPPGLQYFVGSTVDGADRLHYASPDKPHEVVVLGETEQTIEAARLARHNGNRSTFELYGEYATYGRRQIANGAGEFETDPGTDWMWASTLEYSYRILSTLYEINFGLGVIRGHQDTYEDADGNTVPADPIAQLDEGDEPGMNYGWGQLTFEWHRNFSMDVKLLLGASATGFAAGAGGTVRIGRIAGPNLELGGEAFQDIGSLAFMRFGWNTLPRLPMALGYELTTRPNPNAAPANRLIYDLGFVVNDATTINGRFGYTLRSGAVQSGFMGGLSASYSF